MHTTGGRGPQGHEHWTCATSSFVCSLLLLDHRVQTGGQPVSLLLRTTNSCSLVASAKSDGIGPVSAFWLRSRVTRAGADPRLAGSLPMKLLL